MRFVHLLSFFGCRLMYSQALEDNEMDLEEGEFIEQIEQIDEGMRKALLMSSMVNVHI
jgi:hypothetical protein